MNINDYPILCVDDSEPNRVVMKYTLGREFNLIVTESGEQALDVLSRQFVAVLLTDQRMPGMTGVDLAEKTYHLYPDVVRVIITAYSDLTTTIDAINRGRVNRFIKKPWTPEELIAVMHESILARHNSRLVKQLQEQLLSFDRIRTLGILASGIAHDLRQPLAYVVQYVELFKRDLQELISLNPTEQMWDVIREMKHDLEDITTGTKIIRVISSSLLDQIDEKPIKKETLNLNEVVESVVVIARFTVMKRACLEVEIGDEEIEICGCISRLSQLLLNLLLNAAQAILPGAPFDNRVILRIIQNHNAIRIEVEDTGVGITPKDQEEIFKPFFTTKGKEGSGLGLAICKRNVEDHAGTIEVSSTPGKGTVFKVVLPIGELSQG